MYCMVQIVIMYGAQIDIFRILQNKTSVVFFIFEVMWQ